MYSNILFTCLIAATLQFGAATKCYQCTSLTDPRCGDPMLLDESKAVSCTSDVLKQAVDIFNMGAKKFADLGSSLGFNTQAKAVDANLQCSKVDVSEGDKKITIRSCSLPPSSSYDPCKAITEKYTSDSAKVSFCGVCDTDLCNGSSHVHITFAFILPVIALLLAQYN